MFSDRIKQAIAFSKRNLTCFGIAFLDIDRFKEVNDTYGHATGDKLLKSVANTLALCVRNIDTVSRIGGDEFAIIFSSVLDKSEIVPMLNRIFDSLSEPVKLNENEMKISISIGISIYPQDGEDEETLLKHADTAMYQAKTKGRNIFKFFSEELTDLTLQQIIMDTGLNKALKRNELILLYQPQINIKDKFVETIEVSLHWDSPKENIFPHHEFSEIIERSDLSIPVFDWFFLSVCKQIINWNELHLPKIKISLNLFQNYFKQPAFIDMIKSVLNETNLNPESVEFEISENIIAYNRSDIIKILKHFKELGFSLAIDNFGIGFASQSFLRKLPIDKLKVNPEYIQNLPDNNDDKAIVLAIISVAKKLKLDVVATGIETSAQVEFLRQHNCNLMQGSYFTHLLDTQELVKYILNFNNL